MHASCAITVIIVLDRMSNFAATWKVIKKPVAAVIAVVIGAVCAILVTEHEVVTVDPSSVVFITILLVDLGSSESFYVTAILRVLGTLLGLLAGAAISFISNKIVADGISHIGFRAFQLSCLAVLLFVPLVIQEKFPKYGYTSIIFIYTVTALIFSGTSNDITIATVVTLVGGIVIATIVMWIFDYESAELTLLRDHRQLLSHVLTMVKLSVRANPNFKEDYFKILEESKSSFALNIDNITSYKRWMRWTRRHASFDFDALTKGLRPLYHQSASLFWSLCRDRVLKLDGVPANDPCHLYCSSTELYFDNFHELVVEIVQSVDGAEVKLSGILREHPSRLLGIIKKGVRKTQPSTPSPYSVLADLLRVDILSFMKALIRMKHRYFTLKRTVHPNFGQQWLMSDYMYQLSLVLLEVMDYLLIVVDTVIPDPKRRLKLVKRIRVLMIRVEKLNRDGFLFARSFDQLGHDSTDSIVLEELPESDEEDDESIVSGRSDPRGRVTPAG